MSFPWHEFNWLIGLFMCAYVTKLSSQFSFNHHWGHISSFRYPFPTVFSTCSKKDLAASLEKGVGMCLFNMPEVKVLYGGQKCGNGYVEEGEQCDCGDVEVRQSSESLHVSHKCRICAAISTLSSDSCIISSRSSKSAASGINSFRSRVFSANMLWEEAQEVFWEWDASVTPDRELLRGPQRQACVSVGALQVFPGGLNLFVDVFAEMLLAVQYALQRHTVTMFCVWVSAVNNAHAKFMSWISTQSAVRTKHLGIYLSTWKLAHICKCTSVTFQLGRFYTFVTHLVPNLAKSHLFIYSAL